jgi:hypothetical protein
MTIWYIVCSFVTVFPDLVSCTKKNLATLVDHATEAISYAFLEKKETHPRKISRLIPTYVCMYIFPWMTLWSDPCSKNFVRHIFLVHPLAYIPMYSAFNEKWHECRRPPKITCDQMVWEKSVQNVLNLGTRALCHQTECRQTECRQTECRQTECRQTECCQTECRQTEFCFYNIRPNVARLNVASKCPPNEIGLTTPNLT